MTASADEIKARYSKIEREGDKFGRLIGVKRLRPSQQLRLNELTEARDAATVGYFATVASVCEIDGRPVTFPKNRGELDSMADELDSEGTEAASMALQRLIKGDATTEGEGGSSTELTKNSVPSETEKSPS